MATLDDPRGQHWARATAGENGRHAVDWLHLLDHSLGMFLTLCPKGDHKAEVTFLFLPLPFSGILTEQGKAAES